MLTCSYTAELDAVQAVDEDGKRSAALPFGPGFTLAERSLMAQLLNRMPQHWPRMIFPLPPTSPEEPPQP